MWQTTKLTAFVLCLYKSPADHVALPSITLSISHRSNDNNNSASDLDSPSGV